MAPPRTRMPSVIMPPEDDESDESDEPEDCEDGCVDGTEDSDDLHGTPRGR